jgi:hypothetical protein
MNIAILICGEFRWFDSFLKTFQNNFSPALQGHNVQYFAHFWDRGLEKLSNFTKLCDPLIMDIEDQKDHSYVKNFFGFTKTINGTFPNQIYCVYKTFSLLENFQEKNNMTFDLYIKMRLDLVFLNMLKLDDFDSKSIYVKDLSHESRPTSTYVNDYAFFTKNYDATKKIAELGFSFDSLLENPESLIYKQFISHNIYCPEEILAKHLINKKISVKTHNFNIDLARHHI